MADPIRYLAPTGNTVYDLEKMRAVTLARFPQAQDVNVVINADGTESIAMYVAVAPPATTVAAWRADVLANAGTVNPRPDNLLAMQQKARAALTANVTYLANANPSNADNAAQIRALTRQVDVLIKLTLNLLDDTSGT